MGRVRQRSDEVASDFIGTALPDAHPTNRSNRLLLQLAVIQAVGTTWAAERGLVGRRVAKVSIARVEPLRDSDMEGAKDVAKG